MDVGVERLAAYRITRLTQSVQPIFRINSDHMFLTFDVLDPAYVTQRITHEVHVGKLINCLPVLGI